LCQGTTLVVPNGFYCPDEPASAGGTGFPGGGVVKIIATGLLLIALSTVALAEDGLCVRHLDVPAYPTLGRQARLEGSVVLNVDIAPDGEVVSVSTSGAAHKLLQQSAADNVRTWTFCSSLAKQSIVITYLYKLEGDNRYETPPAKVTLDLPQRVTITTNPPQPME
jgi:TonB family protein